MVAQSRERISRHRSHDGNRCRQRKRPTIFEKRSMNAMLYIITHTISKDQGKWRGKKKKKTGRKIICGAPTTPAIQNLMMMIIKYTLHCAKGQTHCYTAPKRRYGIQGTPDIAIQSLLLIPLFIYLFNVLGVVVRKYISKKGIHVDFVTPGQQFQSQ